MTQALLDEWMSAEDNAFETGRNSDVTFVVDGQEIRANRGRIETHSDVFKAMFDNDYEKSGGRLEIKETRADLLSKLIKACYSPSIKLANCLEALELFKLAHQYNIRHVSNYCEWYIHDHKSELSANLIKFYATGDLYGSLKIKSVALDVLRTTFKTLWSLDCKTLAGIETLSADQVCEIFLTVWPTRKITSSVNQPRYLQMNKMTQDMLDNFMSVEEAAFVSGMNADVTFLVKGQKIQANRGQLAKHSNVFKNWLAKYPHAKTLAIYNTTPELFKKLILSCYCPSIKLSDLEEALELYKLAHKYQVNHTLSYCESYITRHKFQLSARNVIRFYSTGFHYESKKMKAAALVVLKSLDCNAEKLKLHQLSADELREVLDAVWLRKKYDWSILWLMQ